MVKLHVIMKSEEKPMKKSKELSPYEKIIQQRIVQLIEEYCEGSQQRFVERTGLNKGSVSQYVNGKNTPSYENAEKIASAFNIEVDWILALDFIPDGVDTESREFIDLFESADPEIQNAVLTLLKSSKRGS